MRVTRSWWTASPSLRPQRILDNRRPWSTRPEEVVEQVLYTRDLLGEIEPPCRSTRAGSESDAFPTLEVFASRVIPRFAQT